MYVDLASSARGQYSPCQLIQSRLEYEHPGSIRTGPSARVRSNGLRPFSPGIQVDPACPHKSKTNELKLVQRIKHGHVLKQHCPGRLLCHQSHVRQNINILPQQHAISNGNLCFYHVAWQITYQVHVLCHFSKFMNGYVSFAIQSMLATCQPANQ